MKLIKSFSHILFILFFLTLSNVSKADVTLNYPGWIFEDSSLPGIPSKNLNEYKAELKSWSRTYQQTLSDNALNSIVELSDETINTYIAQSLNIGFDNEVYISVDGVDESINIQNYQVRDQMRDIIFLQSLKNSIEHWEYKLYRSNGYCTGRCFIRVISTSLQNI